MTNLARAGLARVRNVPYAPLPTVYDGLFPNGTFLTAPTAASPTERADRRGSHDDDPDNAR